MPSDIEIAQAAKLQRISKVALDRLGIAEEHLEPYGHYNKAKVSLKYLDTLKGKKDGKLILVTAMTPTPAGEGKTTTTVGLGDALNHIGKKAAICLREPSLGPVFGVKDGAAGGGYAQVVPMEDINLHFTGDFSAIALANNLLAALLAFTRPRQPESGPLGRFAQARAEPGRRPGSQNRCGTVVSGRLDEFGQPHRGAWRRPGGQPQVREDPDNHGRLFDGGDDLQPTAAVRAMLNVEVEDAFQQTRPAHARRSLPVRLGGLSGLLDPPRHDRRTQSGMRGEHPVEADQVQPRARHQGDQALHEFQQRHHDVGGAVAIGTLQLRHDLAFAIAAEPFVGDRRAGPAREPKTIR